MIVNQVLCAAGRVDAVTNQALAYRRLFTGWGWGGRDFAPVVAGDMPRGTVRHLHELRGREDVLVLHYSGYAPALRGLAARPAPQLLVSHNVTPPRYFWAADPAEAVRCELGGEQLAELARRASRLAGVSRYNAADLERWSGRATEVLPILFGEPVEPPGTAEPLVLFVGRLAPHKRQDLVIRAFAQWHGRRAEARLALVGTPHPVAYGAALRRLAAELAPGAVQFHAGLGGAELSALYRRAGVFLCLSEHEGFCIPLLEAFAHGLPVVARAAAAVPEVVGDAGVLLGEEDGVGVVAEVLELVWTDAELREELVARGRRRLAEFAPQEVARRLRGVLESMVGR
jgi:glycosyltransferase involved in cell wall biosynthesis